MSKQLSRQIDAHIVSCATGMACDEAELMRLATEYRSKYNSPYELNYMHMRSLETDAEKAIALNLEAKINDIDVNHTMQRFYSELGPTGHVFKTRKSVKRIASPPKASPRPSPRACSPKTRRSYCSVQGGTKRRRRQRQQRRRQH